MRKRGLRLSLIAACIMSMAMSFSSYAADFGSYETYTYETENYFRIEDSYAWFNEYMEKYHPGVDSEVYVLQPLAEWEEWNAKGEEVPDVYRILITNEFMYAMNTWQRKCAPYASGDDTYTPRFVYKHRFSDIDGHMSNMLHESDYNKAWLDENMPNIVPEGTDVDDALRICYDWVQDNFTYGAREDKDGNDTDTYLAAVAIDTGKACCVGYASQYRNMVNYLIFDSDNKVVYLEDNEIGPAYKKLNMYVVSGNKHAWNAVRSIHDGSWLYFDPTFDDWEDGEHHYDFYNLSAEQFYDGKEYMVSDGISEPEKWVREMFTSSLEYYGLKVDDINLIK